MHIVSSCNTNSKFNFNFDYKRDTYMNHILAIKADFNLQRIYIFIFICMLGNLVWIWIMKMPLRIHTWTITYLQTIYCQIYLARSTNSGIPIQSRQKWNLLARVVVPQHNLLNGGVGYLVKIIKISWSGKTL